MTPILPQPWFVTTETLRSVASSTKERKVGGEAREEGMEQGREEGRVGGSIRKAKIERKSRARCHEDVEEKQTRGQTGGHTPRKAQAHQHTKLVLELGAMDHEEEGEKEGSQPSAGASPYFQSQRATPSRG